jgi:hypothetical protein
LHSTVSLLYRNALELAGEPAPAMAGGSATAGHLLKPDDSSCNETALNRSEALDSSSSDMGPPWVSDDGKCNTPAPGEESAFAMPETLEKGASDPFSGQGANLAVSSGNREPFAWQTAAQRETGDISGSAADQTEMANKPGVNEAAQDAECRGAERGAPLVSGKPAVERAAAALRSVQRLPAVLASTLRTVESSALDTRRPKAKSFFGATILLAMFLEQVC